MKSIVIHQLIWLAFLIIDVMSWLVDDESWIALRIESTEAWDCMKGNQEWKLTLKK